MKVIIIHGWEGKPDSNWFPWLRNELEDQNAQTQKPQAQSPHWEVRIPQMPNADHPRCDEWVASIQKEVGELGGPGEQVFLVGHSLGVIAILRYLETLPQGSMVGGVISVAGFSEPIGISELDNFLDRPVDFKKVKEVCKKFVVIDSDDDPYVPLSCGETLEKELNAKHITLLGWKHFNQSQGITEVPVVLEQLNEMRDMIDASEMSTV